MAHIINLDDAKKSKPPKPELPNDDITSLLKEASILKGLAKSNEEVITNLPALLQGKMSEVIIKHNLISSEYFLCGIYISKLLLSIMEAKNIPKSWFAIDYICEGNTSKNPQIIKQGANVCLLICTIFQGRAEIKMMTMNYYLGIGATLFRQFYRQTGAEIGYHMSQNFYTMVKVTNECIKNI